MRKKILAGGILFMLILALILAHSGYRRFTAIITQNYEINALRTAQTALTFLDVNEISGYSQNTLARQRILHEWQKIVDSQGETFIYVIKTFSNYNVILFDLNVKNTNSVYDIVPCGYLKPTSSDEYKKAYRDLYEGNKEYAIVVRDHGISSTGDHITAMVPIKNSEGVVKGLLCVQSQMDVLESEKNLFLKQTSAAMLFYLVLMLFVGGKYLNSKLLESLSALTQGVKEISAGNLDKKLDIKTGDELQTLAENFNVMTDELKRQI